MNPLDVLRHHVTGAVQRGESAPVVGVPMMWGDVDVVCEWYALCTNAAVGVVEHPVLGDVPCCRRCADRHDLKLEDATS